MSPWLHQIPQAQRAAKPVAGLYHYMRTAPMSKRVMVTDVVAACKTSHPQGRLVLQTQMPDSAKIQPVQLDGIVSQNLVDQAHGDFLTEHVQSDLLGQHVGETKSGHRKMGYCHFGPADI